MTDCIKIFRADWDRSTNNSCMHIREVLEEFRLEYCFHRRFTVDIESFEHLMFNRTEKNLGPHNSFQTQVEDV